MHTVAVRPVLFILFPHSFWRRCCFGRAHHVVLRRLTNKKNSYNTDHKQRRVCVCSFVCSSSNSLHVAPVPNAYIYLPMTMDSQMSREPATNTYTLGRTTLRCWHTNNKNASGMRPLPAPLTQRQAHHHVLLLLLFHYIRRMGKSSTFVLQTW